jgi:hypothetical protein
MGQKFAFFKENGWAVGPTEPLTSLCFPGRWPGLGEGLLLQSGTKTGSTVFTKNTQLLAVQGFTEPAGINHKDTFTNHNDYTSSLARLPFLLKLVRKA